MAEERPLLALRGVSKSFGGVSAVLDITFDVRAGESVGLVGPNGAGKTTLFNCVCGQLKNDSGSIDFEGRSLRGIPTYKRARMGIGRTYQRAKVFTDMTFRDHLMVAERARSHRGRLWRDLCNMSRPTDEECEKVDRTMKLVGLTEFAETPVSALGLGNCRLVELARALACEPKLLLADEPSSVSRTRDGRPRRRAPHNPARSGHRGLAGGTRSGHCGRSRRQGGRDGSRLQDRRRDLRRGDGQPERAPCLPRTIGMSGARRHVPSGTGLNTSPIADSKVTR